MCPFPIISLICSMLAPTSCQSLSSSCSLQPLAFSNSLDFEEHCALGPFRVETWGNAKAVTYSLGPMAFILFFTKSGKAEEPMHGFLLSLLWLNAPQWHLTGKGFVWLPVQNVWLSTAGKTCQVELSFRQCGLAIWPLHISVTQDTETVTPWPMSAGLGLPPKVYNLSQTAPLVRGQIFNTSWAHRGLSIFKPWLIITVWEKLFQWHSQWRPGCWQPNINQLIHWSSSSHGILIKLVILKVLSITLSPIKSHGLYCKPRGWCLHLLPPQWLYCTVWVPAMGLCLFKVCC